ncbi:MAG: hypothetical protein EBY09_01450 [Verrucomicrobia bacterium]|nr:hypothetical protein [Verrucomicrobiota bacterium]NBU09534.1 hypothetical protein [Pseudomonadota bacterium]NDA65296.1 hypothetical protein [Verrucomicrobiota bacterium]
MSENLNPSPKPSAKSRSMAITVAGLIGAAMLIPSVRHAILAFFIKDEKKLEAATKVIESLIAAELVNQPLPGMKPVPPDLHIVPTGFPDHRLRATWHRTPEGSDAFPVALFRALTDPTTGRPIIESFERYGLIPAPDDDTGLPVGFSHIKAKDHDFVMTGINCATCHSTQITYRGRTLHIDGAPNQLDVEAFFRGMLGALEGILKDDTEERMKFISRFIYYNAIELERMRAAGKLAAAPPPDTRSAAEKHRHTLAFLEARLRGAAIIIESFAHQTAAGPSRADSFGIIRNLLMTPALLGGKSNFEPMTAPVSIPHLFQFGSFTNLHWDGNTTTGNDRNYAQAIALGADFDPKSLTSSVRPYDLYTMESTGQKLTQPPWPAVIFGPLDTAKVARGAELFRSQGCATCHSGETWTRLELIGTDPNRLVNYAVPLHVKDGRTESYATNLYKSAIAVKEKAYADNHVPLAEQKKMDAWHYRVAPAWLETRQLGYFTRPLRGLWATAPFLHNGSVPTLWDLLQPVEQRPKKFAVGHREFDPVHVGYTARPEKVVWEFDTALSGNRNTGHEFGTRLTDTQKWDLVEYLKTL